MSVTPYGFVSPEVRYSPVTGLDLVVPRRTISLIPEDSIMYRGTPQIPLSGVSAQVVVSGQGIIAQERGSLENLNPDSWASFVADDTYWDANTGIWTPAHDSSPVQYTLEGTPGDFPLFDTVEYRSGKELFVQDALIFDDQVLTSNFNEGLDDATNFTLSMAFAPLDTGSSDLVVFDDGGSVGITSTGFTATMDGRSWVVKPKAGPLLAHPTYLVLQLRPPIATLYVGYAPSNFYQGSSYVSRDTTKFAFTLSSPMRLFALDIFGDDAPSARELVAGYSSALGTVDSPIGAFA